MDSVDIEVLRTAEGWRKSGHKAALGTIVKTWGSAPRRREETRAADLRRDQRGRYALGPAMRRDAAAGRRAGQRTERFAGAPAEDRVAAAGEAPPRDGERPRDARARPLAGRP